MRELSYLCVFYVALYVFSFCVGMLHKQSFHETDRNPASRYLVVTRERMRVRQRQEDDGTSPPRKGEDDNQDRPPPSPPSPAYPKTFAGTLLNFFILKGSFALLAFVDSIFALAAVAWPTVALVARGIILACAAVKSLALFSFILTHSFIKSPCTIASIRVATPVRRVSSYGRIEEDRP